MLVQSHAFVLLLQKKGLRYIQHVVVQAKNVERLPQSSAVSPYVYLFYTLLRREDILYFKLCGISKRSQLPLFICKK